MAQINGLEIELDARIKQETLDRDYVVNLLRVNRFTLTPDFFKVFFFDLISGVKFIGLDSEVVSFEFETGFIGNFQFTQAIVDVPTLEIKPDFYETETHYVIEATITKNVSGGVITADWFLNAFELKYKMNDFSVPSAPVAVTKTILTSTALAISEFAESDLGAPTPANGIKLDDGDDAELTFSFRLRFRK